MKTWFAANGLALVLSIVSGVVWSMAMLYGVSSKIDVLSARVEVMTANVERRLATLESRVFGIEMPRGPISPSTIPTQVRP